MARVSQLLKKGRKLKKYKGKKSALQNCPQKKGMCLRVFDLAPRKPNSAQRTVSSVLLSNRKTINAYLPGIGQNTLQRFSVVLVRGGGPKDVPGVDYTMIRGKFDLKRLQGRENARSKYGGQCWNHKSYAESKK